MRKRYIWLSLALGLVLFFIIVHEISWQDFLNLIRSANPKYLTIYLLVSLLIMLQLGVRWKIILHAKGIKLPILTSISYRFAGFAMSFVTPGPRVGGEAVTAGLLTRHSAGEKKIGFSSAFSTIMIDRAIELQAFAILFFIGVLVLALMGDIPEGLRIVMIAAATILLAIMVMMYINVTRGKLFLTKLLRKLPIKRLKDELQQFEDTIVTFYKHDRKEFLLAHLVAGVAWLLSLIEYKYLLLMLGFDVPLYGVFIVYSFVGLAYIIPVPLALGTLEGGQAAAFGLIGLPAAGGIVLALVTRLRDILFTVFGFMILAYHGIATRSVQKTVR